MYLMMIQKWAIPLDPIEGNSKKTNKMKFQRKKLLCQASHIYKIEVGLSCLHVSRYVTKHSV